MTPGALWFYFAFFLAFFFLATIAEVTSFVSPG